MDHLDVESQWFQKLLSLKPWTRTYEQLNFKVFSVDGSSYEFLDLNGYYLSRLINKLMQAEDTGTLAEVALGSQFRDVDFKSMIEHCIDKSNPYAIIPFLARADLHFSFCNDTSNADTITCWFKEKYGGSLFLLNRFER